MTPDWSDPAQRAARLKEREICLRVIRRAFTLCDDDFAAAWENRIMIAMNAELPAPPKERKLRVLPDPDYGGTCWRAVDGRIQVSSDGTWRAPDLTLWGTRERGLAHRFALWQSLIEQPYEDIPWPPPKEACVR